jgi:hypothetical protein
MGLYAVFGFMLDIYHTQGRSSQVVEEIQGSYTIVIVCKTKKTTQ